MMQFGCLVGIDKKGNDILYRVIICKAKNKGNNQFDWAFECIIMTQDQVYESLKRGNKWLNIKLEGDKIKGSTGSLSRFTAEHKPVVIISKIVSDDNKLLGYKIANYEGSVTNIALKEIIAFGNRCHKRNIVPVQNAIYIPPENNKAGHFKSYPGFTFISEVLVTNKNKYAEARRVPLKKNEKTLSSLEEIYSKDQLIQLKQGKSNGVDIRVYASPTLSAEQMEVLRKGLEKKLNVKPIAFSEYTVKSMKYYIDCLENNIDIRKFTNPKYNIGQLAEISLAAELGLDISKLSNPKLTPMEMSEIRERLEAKIWKNQLVKADGSWY